MTNSLKIKFLKQKLAEIEEEIKIEEKKLKNNLKHFGKDNTLEQTTTKISKDKLSIIVNNSWDLDPIIIQTFDEIQTKLHSLKNYNIRSISEIIGFILIKLNNLMTESDRKSLNTLNDELVEIVAGIVNYICQTKYTQK